MIALLRTAVAGAAIVAAMMSPANAVEPSADLIDETLLKEIWGWAHHPVTLISLKAQNRHHATLSSADITALDKRWVAERGADDQPLISQLLGSPLSTYLTRVKANSNGLIVELFVMDDKGLNVGQSSITSDYWQGDEAKWQKTYQAGPKAVFVDAAEFDQESGTLRAQVNMAIADETSGSAIGAITAEINLTELARRKTLSN